MSAGSPLLPHVRRSLRVVTAVLAFAALAAACFPLPQPPAGTYAPTPAVYGADFPDPFVVDEGGGSYRGFSTNAGFTRVPSATSAPSALQTWTAGPDVLARAPTWELPGTIGRYWAPAVHEFDPGTWVLYFTAPNAGNARQCIGVATATAAAGPYEPLVDPTTPAVDAPPIVCDADGGSIDPSVLIAADGTPWIVWKNDGNCCPGLTANIWSQQLADDGLGLEPLSTRQSLVGVTQAWEDGSSGNPDFYKRNIEGPSMVFKNGTYWLFYSANWWEGINYAIGYAKCTTPAGPCTKPRNGPILKSGPNGLGPGGPEVFADAGGQLWVAYHSWPSNKVGYNNGVTRTLRLSRLSLDGSEPVFGAGP